MPSHASPLDVAASTWNPRSPEGVGHGRDRPLGQAVHPIDGAEVEIVVPRDEGAVADCAEAGTLPQEEHNPQLVEDLLCLPEEPRCHGGVHGRDGLHQLVNLRLFRRRRAQSSHDPPYWAALCCQPGARAMGGQQRHGLGVAQLVDVVDLRPPPWARAEHVHAQRAVGNGACEGELVVVAGLASRDVLVEVRHHLPAHRPTREFVDVDRLERGSVVEIGGLVRLEHHGGCQVAAAWMTVPFMVESYRSTTATLS